MSSEIQFTFKQMPSSQALVDLAEEKLQNKIEKFTSRPVHTHVTFSIDGLMQKIHVSMITADGHNIEAEHSGDNMYAELDIIAEKVETQLRRHKERLKNHNTTGIRNLSKKVSVISSQEPLNLDSLADDAIDAEEILNLDKSPRVPLEIVCNS